MQYLREGWMIRVERKQTAHCIAHTEKNIINFALVEK